MDDDQGGVTAEPYWCDRATTEERLRDNGLLVEWPQQRRDDRAAAASLTARRLL